MFEHHTKSVITKVKAYEADQKFKEGAYLIEKALLVPVKPQAAPSVFSFLWKQ